MYKTILHATDLNTNHFDLCKKSVKLAHKFGAKLFLIHVIEIPTSLQLAQGLGFAELTAPIKDGAATVMSTLAEALNLPIEQFQIEIGSAHTHILEFGKKINCDLIILGSSPHSFPALLGSTGQNIMHHATGDVLVLHANSIA